MEKVEREQSLISMVSEMLELVRTGKISAEQAQGALMYYQILENSGYDSELYNLVEMMHLNTVVTCNPPYKVGNIVEPIVHKLDIQ